jgi:hypothetical protein
MFLKLLLQFGEKPSLKRLFQIADVQHSKDDIEVLNKTVLKKIVGGLRVIKDGTRFVLSFAEINKMKLSFCICNVPIHLYINGDMKYFAQMLGREGMSISWCMYCQTHPTDWKGLKSFPGDVLWDIAKQRKILQEINSGQQKKPKDKKSIVSEPVIDFVELKDYIFPQLRFEIGAVNNILDALQAFVEDQVEVLPKEEREGKNSKIIADVALEKAKDSLNRFNVADLKFHRLERVQLYKGLNARGLTGENSNVIMERKQEP